MANERTKQTLSMIAGLAALGGFDFNASMDAIGKVDCIWCLGSGKMGNTEFICDHCKGTGKYETEQEQETI